MSFYFWFMFLKEQAAPLLHNSTAYGHFTLWLCQLSLLGNSKARHSFHLQPCCRTCLTAGSVPDMFANQNRLREMRRLNTHDLSASSAITGVKRSKHTTSKTHTSYFSVAFLPLGPESDSWLTRPSHDKYTKAHELKSADSCFNFSLSVCLSCSWVRVIWVCWVFRLPSFKAQTRDSDSAVWMEKEKPFWAL